MTQYQRDVFVPTYIYIYMPGTQMTLVLIRKGLVLGVGPFKNRGYLGSRYICVKFRGLEPGLAATMCLCHAPKRELLTLDPPKTQTKTCRLSFLCFFSLKGGCLKHRPKTLA